MGAERLQGQKYGKKGKGEKKGVSFCEKRGFMNGKWRCFDVKGEEKKGK